MSKINIDELLEILPKLIRENDAVRGAIISALSGVVATHDDIVLLNEAMDERFKAIQETMDKRFEAMQKTMDKRFEDTDKKNDARHNELMFALNNFKQAFGKPFEQFARNVIVRLLASEGHMGVDLKAKKIKDPSGFISKGGTEIEIDGFSLDPPIIVEITSILRTKEKVDQFIKKKQFVEKEYDLQFRGFFVAASSEFNSEELGEIIVELRKHGCELINL